MPELTCPELESLRRCIRDLTALSAMEALWSRSPVAKIAEGLAGIVLSTVSPEYCYVRLTDPADGTVIEALRTAQGAVIPGAAMRIGAALQPHLRFTTSSPLVIEDPMNPPHQIQLAVVLIGIEGECGVLAVASDRPGFPNRNARTLLSMAANQATMVLERRRAEAVLKQASVQKDEFLATLAHELRNPLAPIAMGLELLQMPELPHDVVQEVYATVDRQVKLMVRLIDDLLDMSRITAGKLDLRKSPADLRDLINWAVDGVRPLLAEAHHTLTVALPPDAIPVDADAARIIQVFSNLLNNACKYMIAGGTITISTEVIGDQVEVHFRDSGIGIPTDKLEAIFDMFAQVDHSSERAQGGLGIGLTLVKRLVTMHGGTVRAISDGPGNGSDFVVQLPLAKVDEYMEQPARVDSARTNAPARRILIVDDNRDAANVLQLMLSSLGNEVRTAYDGNAALEIGDDFRPELVFLDLGMPTLNGYDTARQLRARPWGNDVLLVALTGWGQEEDKRRTESAGFDQHLVKPAKPAELQQLLASLPSGVALAAH